MNFAPRFSRILARGSPWTCRQCSRKQTIGLRTQNFATRARKAFQDGSRKQRRLILATAGAATAGAGSFVFADEIRHYYEASERSARVLSALTANVNDYRTLLNNPSNDPNEQASLMKQCHKRCAERTLQVLEKNGSIFIKLGQHLSSMGYLLPMEWVETFIPLQDQCPVSSYESIAAMYEEDTGKTLSEVFEHFEQEPIGSASLAQVHLATLKGGQEVAVKVQHPNLKEWVPLDMALTRFTFATLKRVFPEYDLEWLSNEMDYSLPQELDFALEGKNAMRMKEYFSKFKDTPLVIPDVIDGKKRILIMECISGHRPDDLKYLDDNGIDRDEVSASLSRIFNEMIFGDGAPLHCDPHGGNIAIRKNDKRRSHNFDIILYDHGLYRDIPKQLKRDYAKLWLAVINNDEMEMRKYAKAVANITDKQFPLFASAITGRDYGALRESVVSSRTSEEKEEISGALSDGMLQELVALLGQVPRIMLLILKTNDLTRSLDENLQTRQGPVRTFAILARYCSRTVFREQMEVVREHGSILNPRNAFRLIYAWTSFMKMELKLSLLEYWIAIKRNLGLNTDLL